MRRMSINRNEMIYSRNAIELKDQYKYDDYTYNCTFEVMGCVNIILIINIGYL